MATAREAFPGLPARSEKSALPVQGAGERRMAQGHFRASLAAHGLAGRGKRLALFRRQRIIRERGQYAPSPNPRDKGLVRGGKSNLSVYRYLANPCVGRKNDGDDPSSRRAGAHGAQRALGPGPSCGWQGRYLTAPAVMPWMKYLDMAR